MLSKLFFLAAVILFVILAVAHNVDSALAWWGAASLAAGFLVEGFVFPHQ